MSNKLITCLLLGLSLTAQLPAQRRMEQLNRGVIAVRATEKTAFISWRLLGTDPKHTYFNLYRQTGNGQPVLLNKKPLTTATCFTDNNVDFSQRNTYLVKPLVKGSKGQAAAEGQYCLNAGERVDQYLSIPLRTPDKYTPGDCSVADLDGDGNYEIVVHMVGIGRDNGQNGLTTPPILQAYKLDGTFLWEINLGINIREGAHYTQFLVYDFDGDGKAELICKTADGTKDGVENIIGDPAADWRTKPTDGNMDPWANRPVFFRSDNQPRHPGGPDSIQPGMPSSTITMNPADSAGREAFNRAQGYRQSRRNGNDTVIIRDGQQRMPPNEGRRQRPVTDPNPLAGKIVDGPEYLTVFEGTTGRALATVNYVPGRGALDAWNDTHANRSERYLAGVAYLDGKHPSAVMCRGYYTRATLVAWDWQEGKLTQRWMFDSYDGTPGNDAYSGQGNHSLSVADVDQDGCDEIVYGACCIDHNGKGLYSTGFGHGDALHCSDLDPKRPGLEVFQVHEEMDKAAAVAAGEFRDAKTGKLLWGLPGTSDVGRGMTADIDPRYEGCECWSVGSHGLYSAKGEKITDKQPRSCNFAVWWDGDLSRELLDRNRITKWNYITGTDIELFRADSCTSINGTKATPNLSADLFGDWREEVILSNINGKELRIFTTTIPTDYRFVTLMHDPQYRLSIAWQNVAYNQPPHPGFFLGNHMKHTRH